jgi:hypothetical protein
MTRHSTYRVIGQDPSLAATALFVSFAALLLPACADVESGADVPTQASADAATGAASSYLPLPADGATQPLKGSDGGVGRSGLDATESEVSETTDGGGPSTADREPPLLADASGDDGATDAGVRDEGSTDAPLDEGVDEGADVRVNDGSGSTEGSSSESSSSESSSSESSSSESSSSGNSSSGNSSSGALSWGSPPPDDGGASEAGRGDADAWQSDWAACESGADAPDTSVDAPADANQATCPEPGSITTLAAAGYPAGIWSDGVNVYWTNDWGGGSIQSVPRAGGPVTTVVGSREGPWGIVVDDTYVYWTENNGGSGQVVKAPKLPDAGTPTVIATGQIAPRGIVFDGTNLYWTTIGSGAAGGGVWTALPDADASVSPIATSLPLPLGIALDGHKAVYWQSYGTSDAHNGTIQKWDPLTSTVSMLATGQSGQFGIVVSPDSSSVYWTNYDQGTVAFTSTTAAVPLAIPTIIATDWLSQDAGITANPRGIVIDTPNAANPADTVIYWTDFDQPGGTVWFYRNGLKCPLASGEGVPQAIFVDDTYVYWANYLGTGAIRSAAKMQ